MNKKLLLTGVSGSIGVHVLAHVLHNTDWDVVGLASFRNRGWTDRINEVKKDHPNWDARYTIYTHDLSAPISPILKEKIGHIDYIINLASLSDVEDGIKNPVPFIENNTALILNMLEYAREVKPESFIQFSTDEVYGPNEKGHNFEEWSTIIPSNPYAASKACQEAIAISYWRTYDVPLIITNTVNNFGEMQSPKKFPVIIQKKLAKGEAVVIHGNEGESGTRFYIHSRNVADALLFILKNLPPYHHKNDAVDRPDRYNITSDDELSNLDLAQLIAKSMGKELRYEFLDFDVTRPGHDRSYSLSGEKLKKLGWKMPVSLEKSMADVVEWQTENNEWIH